mmetsp:Transcript_14609/g.22558  ORF Transcript_14609/g.22558 Transcript_14609/m.22558 type:complete len:140 (-) Transcript_14609:288-707(-)
MCSSVDFLAQVLCRFGLFSTGIILASAIVIPQNFIYPWRASVHYDFYTSKPTSHVGMLAALLYINGALKSAWTGEAWALFPGTLAAAMFVLMPVGEISWNKFFGVERNARPKIAIGSSGKKIPRVGSEGNFRARVLKNN